jgi:phosphohistidine phosphatase
VELYLIRHAHALPLGENGINLDEDRRLSETGEAQTRTIAEGLRRRGIALELIVTSPLARARQTADGVVGHWSAPAPEVQVCEELAPGGSKKRLARFLRQSAKQRVAVVGHEPDLSEWAAWLIGGKNSRIELAKAGVACINCEAGARKGCGALIWLVTPEWMG